MFLYSEDIFYAEKEDIPKYVSLDNYKDIFIEIMEKNQKFYKKKR